MDTGDGEELQCEWCGEGFERRSKRGPKPRFCSNGHRQAAHRDRQQSSIFDEVFLNFDTSIFDDLISSIGAPLIDASIFETILPNIELPAIDTSIFDDLTPGFELPAMDTSVFETITANIELPLIDTSIFDDLTPGFELPAMDTSILETITANIAAPLIDTSIFETILPNIELPTIDTSIFETIPPNIELPLIDTSIFDDLTSGFELPAIDTSVFDNIVSNVEPAWLEDLLAKVQPSDLDALLPLARSAVPQDTRLKRSELEQLALLLLIGFWMNMFRAELAHAVEHLLQTFWTVWKLQWQLKNSSPEGDLAVSLAQGIAMFLLGRANSTSAHGAESSDSD